MGSQPGRSITRYGATTLDVMGVLAIFSPARASEVVRECRSGERSVFKALRWLSRRGMVEVIAVESDGPAISVGGYQTPALRYQLTRRGWVESELRLLPLGLWTTAMTLNRIAALDRDPEKPQSTVAATTKS